MIFSSFFRYGLQKMEKPCVSIFGVHDSAIHQSTYSYIVPDSGLCVYIPQCAITCQ